jgi:MFS family permease
MTASPHLRDLSAELPQQATSLGSRRGVAILLLLSLVQFMDILDASILNIALPSIKHDLGFSQQSLQWVVDGYILTYGGFLLLGARMGVVVSSSVHKSGAIISGDAVHIVVVKVNPGYAPNPFSHGTGTIVASFC